MTSEDFVPSTPRRFIAAAALALAVLGAVVWRSCNQVPENKELANASAPR